VNKATQSPAQVTAAVIGAGPAGLMAAETLAARGWSVDVYDGMPSVGRKFLLAGVGGMNITHSEPQPAFVGRYPDRRDFVRPWLQAFSSDGLRQWVHDLGIETFVGSSGRVFPREMKAAPLLRAWLARLRQDGVRIHVRHRWLGWDAERNMLFKVGARGGGIAGEARVQPAVVVLALGGGSWPRLGTDGAWLPLLEQQGVEVSPLKPANCGFDVNWSEHFQQNFAGRPLKQISIRLRGADAPQEAQLGECVVTADGIEGSLIYALSSSIRQRIEQDGDACIAIDLLPDQSRERLLRELSKPRGSRSMASYLRQRARLEGVKANLLREVAVAETWHNPEKLVDLIKALPLRLVAPRPLSEAISSAGGVPPAALGPQLMLNALPGVFCAGEMLDWEAPTGGYLLTACFASGRLAGEGAHLWLTRHQTRGPIDSNQING